MKLRFEFENQDHVGYVQKIGENIWVHVDGETKCITATSKAKRKDQAGATSNQIVSPMPGKVTKIIRKSGEAIQAGEAVIAIEAMKMEYILKAEISGKIDSIQASVGDLIKEGQLLVKIGSLK